MKSFREIIIIIMIFLVASALGALFASTDTHPDIMSKQTGFLAPVIGPWSFALPPHESKLTPSRIFWKSVFTVMFVAVLAITVTISRITKKQWLRTVVLVVGYTVIAFWCLTGVFRVFLELVMT
jgi:hypothetical protein